MNKVNLTPAEPATGDPTMGELLQELDRESNKLASIRREIKQMRSREVELINAVNSTQSKIDVLFKAYAREAPAGTSWSKLDRPTFGTTPIHGENNA